MIAGYDNFYDFVSKRIRIENGVEARPRTFLPDVKVFDFASTEVPFKYGASFALRDWNVLGQHGTQQPGQ